MGIMGQPTKHTRGAICPRCGYDFEGEVSTWREACPLNVVCVECGFRADMIDVLGRGQTPAWFIGVGQGWRGMFRRVPGTAVRVLFPFRETSRLRLAHFQRSFPDRALVTWLFSLLLLAAAFVGIATASVESRNIIEDLGAGPMGLECPQDEFIETVISRSGDRLLLVGIDVLEGFPAVTGQDRWLVRLDIRKSAWGLEEPNDDLLDPRWPLRRVARILSPPASWVGLAVLLTPMTFLLLPVSLRRCRISWSQMLRIACLSLSLLLLPVGCEAFFSTLSADPGNLAGEISGRPRGGIGWSFGVGPALLYVWLVFWWVGACRMLGLPRAPWVAGTMVLMATLLAMAITGPDALVGILRRWRG